MGVYWRQGVTSLSMVLLANRRDKVLVRRIDDENCTSAQEEGAPR